MATSKNKQKRMRMRRRQKWKARTQRVKDRIAVLKQQKPGKSK